MSGIGVLLDLLRNKSNYSSIQTLHSFSSFNAKVGVSSVAASFTGAYPFGFRAFLGSNDRIAHSDSGTTWTEENFSKDYFERISKELGLPKYDLGPATSITGKVYNIEIKPLLSAFHWRSFGLTILRAFLMNYSPLLEPQPPSVDDGEDLFPDDSDKKPVDLVAPFYKSLKQITLECTVITTRRLLEGFAVSHFSRRMAWKLLKDARRSAKRKAIRGLPTNTYFCAVTKTSFRAHCLGVAATWIVQLGIDIYITFSRLYKSRDDSLDVNKTKELKLIVKKVYLASLKCTTSLIFAAIGAGLGATLIHPSIGQWIGCAGGDLGGPLIVAFCFDKLLLTGE